MPIRLPHLLFNVFHPVRNAQAFKELVGLITRHRELTLEMTRNEIREQYVGQLFGAFWAIAHPLFVIALFVFVFNFVFKARVGGTLEMPLDYTAYILSGLLPWLGFQQIMARACTALTAHANLVKQVVFPIEILPAKIVLAGFITQFVSLAALVAYVFVTSVVPHSTYLLLPVLFVIQLFAMLGVAFAFAAAGAIFRDIKDFAQVFTTWGVYLAPIIYLPNWVPEQARIVLYMNPFSYMVWCYQDALYYGRFEHPWAWVVFAAGSLFLFIAGYRLFRRIKPQLGNVL